MLPGQQAGRRHQTAQCVCLSVCVSVEAKYLISKESDGPVAVSQCLTLNEGMSGSLLMLTTRVIYAPTDLSAWLKVSFVPRTLDGKQLVDIAFHFSCNVHGLLEIDQQS